MSLAAGTKLGPYEILAPIGAGGMGEVYRARDSRLNRMVAIKILPPEMSADPERRRRFEQEARSVAALSHPNIVAVYDVGVQDGLAFLVQELVEGEPLRALIERGDLTIHKAVALAARIAAAMAAAHQAGIVHRDLKPENIMVTAQGAAKVLDFGLARQSAAVATAAGEDLTRTLAQTQEGVVLGTLGYMSPEQVRGKPADARSDIFSFGVVFHEMLTGRRTFQGGTPADTLSAILKEDPPDLPAAVPAGVRQVVLHCLEKDPASRFQSAQDLAFALHALSGTSVSTPALAAAVTPPPPAPRRPWRWLLAPAAAACILVGAFAGGARVASVPDVDYRTHHHTQLVPEVPVQTRPRWAPDGKSFTYRDQSHILIQHLDAASPTAILAISHMKDNPVPFFSADGSRVWYTSVSDNRSVWSVGTAGGDPQQVIRDLGGFGNWDGAGLTRDGKSLVVARVQDGAVTLSISTPPGASLQPLAGAPVVRGGTVNRIRLRFTPDGRKLLAVFAASNNTGDGGLWIMPWPPGPAAARRIDPPLKLKDAISNADWLPDNRHIIVGTLPPGEFHGGGLMMIDSESGAVWPLTQDNADASNPVVGPDGRILYVRERAPYDLVETPVNGGPQRTLLASHWTESFGAWSPAADEFVYVGYRGGESAIWIASADGAWQRKVIGNETGELPQNKYSPEFSPDGKRIAYTSGGRVWISPVSGGRPTRVTPENQFGGTPTWSADGKWIAYATRGGLMKVQVGSSAPPVKIAGPAMVPTAWSPDGRWITTGSEKTIDVVSPDGKERRILFNRPFVAQSALGWSRDGATLFLMEGGGFDPLRLSAFDLARGTERLIHEYPVNPADPYVYADPFQALSRLYPSRDGKYLLGARFGVRSSIWMLEGVAPPRSLLNRLLK